MAEDTVYYVEASGENPKTGRATYSVLELPRNVAEELAQIKRKMGLIQKKREDLDRGRPEAETPRGALSASPELQSLRRRGEVVLSYIDVLNRRYVFSTSKREFEPGSVVEKGQITQRPTKV